MPRTTIERGCQWCETCLYSDESWGEGIDCADAGDAVRDTFHRLCAKRGYPEITWYPKTSEVHGEDGKNYDKLDLDELCQMATESVVERTCNGEFATPVADDKKI